MNINRILTTLLGMALCLPLAASSESSCSSQQSLQSAPINSVLIGDNEQAIKIFKYLTFSDYININLTAKEWSGAIQQAIKNNDTNLLVLPKGNKLIAYTKYLLDNAPKEDLARLSVIKELTSLAVRSYQEGGCFLTPPDRFGCRTWRPYSSEERPHPRKTFFNAFCLYTTDVPDRANQICGQYLYDHNVMEHTLPINSGIKEFYALNKRIQKVEHALSTRQTDVARQAGEPLIKGLKRQQQEIVEQLNPLLKVWRAYGILLKLAQNSGYSYALTLAECWYRTLEKKNGGLLNLLEAPQICDVFPDNPRNYLPSNVLYVIGSQLTYLQASYHLNFYSWCNSAKHVITRAEENLDACNDNPAQKAAVALLLLAAYDQRIDWLQKRVNSFTMMNAPKDEVNELATLKTNRQKFIDKYKMQSSQLKANKDNLLTQPIADNNAK